MGNDLDDADEDEKAMIYAIQHPPSKPSLPVVSAATKPKMAPDEDQHTSPA